jgi:hypothetical protein
MISYERQQQLEEIASRKNKGSKSMVRNYGPDDNDWFFSCHEEVEYNEDDIPHRHYVPDDSSNARVRVTDDEWQWLSTRGLIDIVQIDRMLNYVVKNPRRNFVLKA